MRLPLDNLLGPGTVEVRGQPEATHGVLQPPERALLGPPEEDTIVNFETGLKMYSLVKSLKDRKSERELSVNLISQLKKLLKLGDVKLISVH